MVADGDAGTGCYAARAGGKQRLCKLWTKLHRKCLVEHCNLSSVLFYVGSSYIN